MWKLENVTVDKLHGCNLSTILFKTHATPQQGVVYSFFLAPNGK